MKLSHTILLPTIFSLVVAAVAHGYEIVNHSDITDTAAKISTLGQATGGLQRKLFRIGLRPFDLTDPLQTFPLQTNFPDIRECFGEVKDKDGNVIAVGVQPLSRDQYQIAELFRYGACFEDNEGVLTGLRPLAHFYDPQHNGRGMNGGPSSPDWVLTRTGYTNNTGENHFTYMDARDAFYNALTRNSAGGANTAVERARDRREQWALTFQSLGHVVHHLQDMAQPQHVRHDDHCDKPTACGLLGQYKPSAYEKYLQSRADFVRGLASTASAPIVFGLPREFWSMQGNSVTGHYPANQGIAAYTSTNYVSAGTDFTMERSGATPVPYPNYDFPYPIPAPQSNDVSLATLFQGTQPENTVFIRDQLCAGDLANCKMRFYGSDVQRNARKSSISLFSQDVLGGAGSPTAARPSYFTQNYWTYAEAAGDLIPKAVEYSAGLINYFFRGEMEISLPDEGVYGILDHAVTNAKGDGFKFIKLKVKNTTVPLTTARGNLAQHMTNGSFRLVAKFHRNTCYTPDLKGQIGTVGRGASAIANAWSTCRSPVEEIVVSDPEPNISSLLADGNAVTMAFDFINAIPIEATDLYLQIVFKGTLGEEENAVAVTTKSISEPSFLTHLDVSDQILCSTSEPTICRRVADIRAPVYFRDEQASQASGDSLAPFQRSLFGFNRWLGFNPDLPRSKVIEWHAVRSDVAFFNYTPAYQVDRGSYRRVAVLGNVDSPDRVINWGSATERVLTTVDTGDVPVTFGLYNTSSTYVPTTDDLVFGVQKFVATRLKEPADGTAPTLLPTYSTVRGVVVGATKTRPAEPDWLPTLLYSWGENVLANSWYDAAKHPPNSTVHELGPTLPGSAVRAVGSLNFSRAPAYVLPPYTATELNRLPSDVDGEKTRNQPRFTRTLETPANYHWTLQ